MPCGAWRGVGAGGRAGFSHPVQGARGEGKTVKQKLAIKLRYFLVSKKRVSLCLCLFSEEEREGKIFSHDLKMAHSH